MKSEKFERNSVYIPSRAFVLGLDMKARKKRKKKIPVIRGEEISETYQTRDDPDVVRYSRVGNFLKNGILWYVGLNIGFYFIYADGSAENMTGGLFQVPMLVWAGFMAMLFDKK